MSKKYDLTIKEASERLGKSISTIRRMIKHSQLTRVYEDGKYGRIAKLSSEEVNQLAMQSGMASTLPMQLDTIQLINLGRFEKLEEEYRELKAKYEQAVFQLGQAQAERQRRLELEEHAQSLREEKSQIQREYEKLKEEYEELRVELAMSWWDKLKRWWRGGK